MHFLLNRSNFYENKSCWPPSFWRVVYGKDPRRQITSFSFLYLVVLWGNRRRWWRYLRLSLCIPVIRGSVGWLVSSISTGSNNWCRPSNSNRAGCRGVGCCHRVCRHRCLMHSIAGHCSGVGVCYPSGRLLTAEDRTRGLDDNTDSYAYAKCWPGATEFIKIIKNKTHTGLPFKINWQRQKANNCETTYKI